MIVVDNELFSIVHRVGFKRLMNSIEPQYSLPSLLLNVTVYKSLPHSDIGIGIGIGLIHTFCYRDRKYR